MLLNTLQMIGGCMVVYAGFDPRGFGIACAVGLILATFLWWFCSFVVKRWNRSFAFSWFHQILCGIAACWTVFFSIAFLSVNAVDGYFNSMVSIWDTQTRAQVAQGVEKSVLNALEQFEQANPFVRKVLDSDDTTQSRAYAEAAGSASVTTVDRVATTLEYDLKDKVEWTVFRLRIILLLSFLFAQGIVYGLTGFAAYRNIRPAL